MKCYCGGKLKTIDSRPAPLNTIRRNKKCLSCGLKITSYEYIDKYPTSTSENTSSRKRNERKNIAIIGMS